MSELVIDDKEFFAPMSSDMVDLLIGQYNAKKALIVELSEFVSDSHKSVLCYFSEGNTDRYTSISGVFTLKPAIKALDSEFWSKALALTDVLDYMPAKRRDEWHNQLKCWKEPRYKEGQNPAHDLPPFEEEIVRNTLLSMLTMRTQFLSEKVDGIFYGLSGEHVTNQPQGFGKRMIVAGVIDMWGYSTSGRSGIVNDLRTVIAKFMGRDEPCYGATSKLIDAMKWNYGEWMLVDGGALRIRLYKKGTCHIEIHPDMAWRLNSILANLYPMAIPAKFRQKPPKTEKKIDLIQKPLSFAVIDVLSKAKPARYLNERKQWVDIKTSFMFDYATTTKHIDKEINEVIEAIGGVKVNNYYQFDYDYQPILREIIVSGLIPDKKSHQFYPTPASLCIIAAEFAGITDNDSVLEPSAGAGALLAHLPTHTKAIEISPLRCEILKSKGFDVECADFIEWSNTTAERFNKIVMNPPYDQGQWHSHVINSAKLINNDGRLVAILPTSAKSKLDINGFDLKFYGPYDNFFSGTSISVLILVADKK